MKGLLAKDFYMILKTNSLLWYIAIIVFYAIALNFPVESLLIISLLLVITTPITSISYDELSHWQQYSLTLPYSRKQIVSSKYIFTFLIELIFAIIAAVLIGADMLSRDEFKADQLLCFIGMMCLVGAVYPAFAIPLNLLFGTSKARFILVAFMGATFAAVFSLAPMLRNVSSFEELFSDNAYFLCAVLFASTAVLLFVSWLVSVKIYEKKEF